MLESAIANAENNEGADIDELKVSEVFVNAGHDHEANQAASQRSSGSNIETVQSYHRDGHGRVGNSMGQKVHPTGIRLGIVKDHTSVWYADKKTYPEYLLNDLEVREYLRKRLAQASISRIEIERPAQTANHDSYRATGHRDRQER